MSNHARRQPKYRWNTPTKRRAAIKGPSNYPVPAKTPEEAVVRSFRSQAPRRVRPSASRRKGLPSGGGSFWKAVAR